MWLVYSISRRRFSDSVRGYFFIPTGLALITSFFILFYISSTSNIFFIHSTRLSHSHSIGGEDDVYYYYSNLATPNRTSVVQFDHVHYGGVGDQITPPPPDHPTRRNGKANENEEDVFHDQDIFMEDYLEMNKSLKIYIYPHSKDDPFANVLLPVDFEPKGNYASESYFKKAISNSHFITKDPSEASFFYLPFSIARLRHDPRVGIEGIQDFIHDYVMNISVNYPYWNRSCGADHFYVACHSIGRSAIKKASQLKLNAIQIVCSSSYFVSSYVAHKDASLPQIWPRTENAYEAKSSKYLALSQRNQLAFFAGSINSPVREKLVSMWGNDTEISVNVGRVKSSYTEALMQSKFCLHVKGFEVNTARIADALYYGCVPVIIANHYDMPYTDILNWKSFSIVVPTLDIPKLKHLLKSVSYDEYVSLQMNVLKVRRHFQWHVLPLDFDSFYMIMYELWLRRVSLVRFPFY